MKDCEPARARVRRGQRRDSLALTDGEKERVAYHEGGHAVLAYALPYADPVHKVTILPTGMALGVTQQLPMEERHIYPREYIEDSLAVRMGGRVAELLIYGGLSTGANNDLVGNTELARKMVREWGMSDRVGPMAWGSQGAVFLGEDLMHSRDYSDETSRVIDEEGEHILRAQEERAHAVTGQHRPRRGPGPPPPGPRRRRWPAPWPWPPRPRTTRRWRTRTPPPARADQDGRSRRGRAGSVRPNATAWAVTAAAARRRARTLPRPRSPR